MEIQTAVESDATRATETTGALVSVEELHKSYGDLRAVCGVSFEVRRGEVFGLLGPNGAGKTTTVEIIEGLRLPDAGRASVCGFDPVTEAREVKGRIGVALQATALPDKIKVREALSLFASLYPRRAIVDELLAMVSLEEKADSLFDTLSGGQKQRLAVALALANDPEVVILDEPTAGLDAQARRELHRVIASLGGRGKTVILTTHYIEEAEKLCDRVAIMSQGKIIAMGSPRRLIADSRNSSRIEFTAEAPVNLAELRSIPFVLEVGREGGGYVLRAADGPRAVVELIRWLEAEGNQLLDLHVARPTLEDVYIELTGRRIAE
jgi:ABC-2 type transport system ATP-binding protein